MKTIAITGAGGYVGTTLVKKLLNLGYKVKCMDNFHKGQCDSLLAYINNPNFEFIYGDVSIPEDCKKIVKDADTIIHLAGIVGFPACKKQPQLSYAVNVMGTKNILEARSYSQKLLFASTGSVYGKIQDVCTEESPLQPQSLYGIHKLQAEDMVTSAHNTVSFRFATGFGVSPCMRVNLLVNDLVFQAITNGCITIFQPDFRRTFIHVEDMANAFIYACTHDMKHKVYNVGDSELNWSKRRLAEFIKERTNCFLSYGEFASDADQRDYEVDYSRINSEGWKAVKTMEVGIQELIKATPLLQISHQYM